MRSQARKPSARCAADPPTEALLATLWKDVDEGVLVLDAHGRVHDLNPPAQRLLGWSRAAARGRPGSEVLRSPAPGDAVVGKGSARQPRERELLVLARGGGEIPVLMRRYPLPRPLGQAVTLRDLSRMRRLQQEVRLRDRLATLGQLSAGVAHEIRNPLAGIGTSAQVLLRRFEPRDERTRFVQVILNEVNRLDRIVDSLLQYARPRAPELKAHRLEDCARRVLDLLQEPIAQHHIRVELEPAPRLGPVFIDADLVSQVLLNVSLNAIQAMPEGGLLRIELRRVRRRIPQRGVGRRATDPPVTSGGLAPVWQPFQQVRVVDNGPGIPRHLLSKLFAPFFSTRPRGTGLGLAISQTIMQEHGGSIEIASREGRGTTVLLNFPVEKRHAERRKSDAGAGHAHAAHR
jgi:two-component system sensor histidine kinase HydH